MTRDPLRMREDPQQPHAMRRQLAQPIESARDGYDLSSGLARFEAARSAVSTGGGIGRGWNSTRPIWTARLAAALAGSAAIGLVAWLAVRSPPQTTARAPVTPVSHHEPEQAVEQPVVRSQAPAAPPAAIRRAPPAERRAASSIASPGARRPVTPPAVPSLAAPPAEPSANPPPQPSPEPSAEPPRKQAPVADDSFAREIAIVSEARSVAQRDPARALALTDDAKRRFPSGVLREEREWIAISSLARLGRSTEVRQRAQDFLGRYPKSAYLDQIHHMLEIVPAP